jgi:acyl dehydratase
MDQYYEDVTVGESHTFGSYDVTREEIVRFAEQYDPLPFHTDPAAAEESMFGGLVASGWHTAAMTMRLLVDNYLATSGAMGSPGVDSIRFLEPVRPGDELGVRTEVLDKEPWDDDGDRGLVRLGVRTYSEAEVDVLRMEALVLYPRR